MKIQYSLDVVPFLSIKYINTMSARRDWFLNSDSQKNNASRTITTGSAVIRKSSVVEQRTITTQVHRITSNTISAAGSSQMASQRYPNVQSLFNSSPAALSYSHPTNYSPDASVFQQSYETPPTQRPAGPVSRLLNNIVIPKLAVVRQERNRRLGNFVQTLDSTIPTYETNGPKRGKLLLINNINFETNSQRRGGETDTKNLRTVFKQLNFQIIEYQNLTAAKMTDAIDRFSKDSTLKQFDIVMIIIMSHGVNRKHISGTEIYGIDDKPVNSDTVLGYFTAEKCPRLAEKPKIFIFQCCRSFDAFQQSDAVPIPRKAIGHSNMLIAFSTLPGFNAYRDPKNGTWYISTLCEVLCEFAYKFHLEELLKLVDDRISKDKDIAQVTTYESRGFKRCYLNP